MISSLGCGGALQLHGAWLSPRAKVLYRLLRDQRPEMPARARGRTGELVLSLPAPEGAVAVAAALDSKTESPRLRFGIRRTPRSNCSPRPTPPPAVQGD